MIPPRVIYLRCAENRVEDDYDGGLVLLQPTQGQVNDDLVDGRLVLSFKHDAPMRDFPVTREEKGCRFFRVTLDEVTYDDLPPDPATLPPAPPSAKQLLVEAQAAAEREGVSLASLLPVVFPAPPTPPAPPEE